MAGKRLRLKIFSKLKVRLSLEVYGLKSVTPASWSLDETEELEKLETLFPTEYETFMEEDKNFLEKIATIIADEAENVDADFEEKLTELTTVADKFKVDIKEVKKQIENKIEEKKIDDENSYDWDSEDSNDTTKRMTTTKLLRTSLTA